MFSFEGTFRSTPTVSLGGRSKKSSTSSISGVVEKARAERHKREEARKQQRSSVILQASIRSYLCRKKIKEKFRKKFDDEKQKLKNLNNFEAATWLCFFYEEKVTADAERLVWLSQRLLRSANKLDDWSSSFLLTRVVVLCCKCLLDNTLQQIAIPLRMLEVFSNPGFWVSKNSENAAFDKQILFWTKLMSSNFFSCLLHTFESKVPHDLKLAVVCGNRLVSPHHVLADSLIAIMKQPLHFAGTNSPPHASPLFYRFSSDKVKGVSDLIINRFICEVASSELSPLLHNYLLPSLRSDPSFPHHLVLSQVVPDSLDHLVVKPGMEKICPSINLLAAVVRLCKDLADDQLINCVAWMMPLLRPLGEAVDSDDDEFEPRLENDDDVASLQNVTTRNVINALNTGSMVREALDRCNVETLSTITHHMVVGLRRSVHENRFLYTLSFSSHHLKRMWASVLSAAPEQRPSSGSHSAIEALIHGRSMESDSRRAVVSRLVSFATLYCHNLLSMHDADFHRTDPSSRHANPFSLVEVVRMVVLLRDLCLNVLMRIFPEHRLVNYDVRELFQRLSSGTFSSSFDLLRSQSAQDDAILFKVCSRLLGQLYIRDTRRPLSDNPRLWLSPTAIDSERTSRLSTNWRRRRLREDNIAAHMADPSDEDLLMTVSEARQLCTLVCLPFVAPFETRVAILTSMLAQDRQQRETSRDVLMEDAGLASAPSRLVKSVKVRRDFIYEDSFNDLSPANAPDLRAVLRVTFVNSAGAEEAGYGQGVTREFFQLLIRTAFDPGRGMFQIVNDSELCPNPHADRVVDDPLRHYHFLGRLVGKVLYEGMQVELRFAALFLCKLLRPKNADLDINHLQLLDPDYYKNLMFLRSYEGDVAELDLNFTVVDDRFGETTVTELFPGGQDLVVNNFNRFRYIHLLAHYKLNVQMRAACDAFREGLASVLPLEWLRMFDHRELQTLISGAEVAIDVGDMRRNSVYSGGYQEEHETVQLFWRMLESFSEEEKRKLLFFVTSCSRPPLLGFKEMHPSFCIHNGGSPDRLPTSSTCLNLFRLPRYESIELMREKVLYCIDSQSGFELS